MKSLSIGMAHRESQAGRNAVTAALLLIFALAATGCTSFESSLPEIPWKPEMPWKKDRSEMVIESKYGQPNRMAVIWKPDAMQVPGKPPVRGFGGRLYFYNDENQAVPVDGQLIVYAFDDSNQQSSAQVPDRKFGFTPEQFKRHYSESDLGASYSIWIPWDVVGSPQRNISLLPVFTSVSGHVVMGQQSSNLLRGPTPDEGGEKFGGAPGTRRARRQRADLAEATQQLVAQVAYDQTVDETQEETQPQVSLREFAAAARAKRRKETLTISVPRTMSEKLTATPSTAPASTSPVAYGTSRAPVATGSPGGAPAGAPTPQAAPQSNAVREAQALAKALRRSHLETQQRSAAVAEQFAHRMQGAHFLGGATTGTDTNTRTAPGQPGHQATPSFEKNASGQLVGPYSTLAMPQYGDATAAPTADQARRVTAWQANGSQIRDRFARPARFAPHQPPAPAAPGGQSGPPAPASRPYR